MTEPECIQLDVHKTNRKRSNEVTCNVICTVTGCSWSNNSESVACSVATKSLAADQVRSHSKSFSN